MTALKWFKKHSGNVFAAGQTCARYKLKQRDTKFKNVHLMLFFNLNLQRLI